MVEIMGPAPQASYFPRGKLPDHAFHVERFEKLDGGLVHLFRKIVRIIVGKIRAPQDKVPLLLVLDALLDKICQLTRRLRVLRGAHDQRNDLEFPEHRLKKGELHLYRMLASGATLASA